MQTGPLIVCTGWASTVCWPSACLPDALSPSAVTPSLQNAKNKTHRVEATCPRPHSQDVARHLLIPEPTYLPSCYAAPKKAPHHIWQASEFIFPGSQGSRLIALHPLLDDISVVLVASPQSLQLGFKVSCSQPMALPLEVDLPGNKPHLCPYVTLVKLYHLSKPCVFTIKWG